MEKQEKAKGMKRRGELTLKILEKIGEATIEMAELWEAICVAGYGASQGEILRIKEKKHSERAQSRKEREKEMRLLYKYSNLLSKLKRENCIVENKKDGRRFFTLTFLGHRKRKKLHEQLSDSPPPPYYPHEKGTKILIVTFDIPESMRRKRDWLRAVLKNMELQMVQKSVWIGKTKIPEDFLEDLRELKLLEFVEIFEISNTGSLHHIA